MVCKNIVLGFWIYLRTFINNKNVRTLFWILFFCKISKGLLGLGIQIMVLKLTP